MSEDLYGIAYVDSIAPEHDRTSCSDDNLYNAAYGIDDYDGRGRCYRCTLLRAATVPAGSRVVLVELLRDLLDEGSRSATWAAQDKIRALLEVKP